MNPILITPKHSIVLIGMPGSGKSTIGVLLAKYTARAFIDTDLLIQSAVHQPLQRIIDSQGYMALRRIEEEVICGINAQSTIVATGGSAVYSSKAMEHLSNQGVIVFFDIGFVQVCRRITDFDSRGIAMRPGQSFEDLYNERRPLYQKHANITISSDTLTHEQTVLAVLARCTPV